MHKKGAISIILRQHLALLTRRRKIMLSFIDALPGAASQGLIWGIMAIGL